MAIVQGTQSVSRALTVLRAIAGTREAGMTLGKLTALTGLNKPTAHRLLQVLVLEGMVEKDQQLQRYFLGPECHVLGVIASKRFGITKLAEGIVTGVAQFCGDTAFLSITHGSESICVLREDGDYPLKTHALQPGTRHPLGIVAGGLSILAEFTDDEVERCLKVNEELLSKNYSQFSTELLRKEVKATRERGYAVNQGLLVPGSWAIAVPVYGAHREIAGALGIAAVESRLQQERQDELIPKLKQAAKRLEELLLQSERASA
ncbi:IclR family transcriptional regulator [Motiliproteus sp. MSK22-1]|uniref:IclR family transcriptional regulator n=1 Tax=Motiliproteus sp. MSK22-1 TaxID=1897630 RepID=UPI000978976E|nr:IclR family transcriptional regulator [Motiliproteus sp. MSK22-1]OMH27986.1 transcriptional regulator [Motiliproteus sp. MSK22-1]